MNRPHDVNTRILCELRIFQTPCDFPCGFGSLFACLREKWFSCLTRSATKLVI